MSETPTPYGPGIVERIAKGGVSITCMSCRWGLIVEDIGSVRAVREWMHSEHGPGGKHRRMNLQEVVG